MARVPSLGSLRSIANAYDEEDISDEEELSKLKKRKLSSEAIEKSESLKEDDSDFNIVVSDEEGNSSGAGSANNVVVQPKVTKGSRLVSYIGDEDDDDDIRKSMEIEVPLENESSLSTQAPTQESEELLTTQSLGESSNALESQPTPKTEETQTTQEIQTMQEAQSPQETKNSREKDDKKGAMPTEIAEHLAAIKAIQVTLPAEPEGRCSNSLQEKIENLLEKRKRAGSLKHTIQRKKNFRNPSIYEKLVSFCSIDEIGTNYPKEIYDPFSWTEDSFYERLSKIQKENHEKKQKERSKVEFVSATKKTSSSTTSGDGAPKRRSKWDVTSAGTATLTIPASAMQTMASVQAVVANMQGKKV